MCDEQLTTSSRRSNNDVRQRLINVFGEFDKFHETVSSVTVSGGSTATLHGVVAGGASERSAASSAATPSSTVRDRDRDTRSPAAPHTHTLLQNMQNLVGSSPLPLLQTSLPFTVNKDFVASSDPCSSSRSDETDEMAGRKRTKRRARPADDDHDSSSNHSCDAAATAARANKRRQEARGSSWQSSSASRGGGRRGTQDHIRDLFGDDDAGKDPPDKRAPSPANRDELPSASSILALIGRISPKLSPPQKPRDRRAEREEEQRELDRRQKEKEEQREAEKRLREKEKEEQERRQAEKEEMEKERRVREKEKEEQKQRAAEKEREERERREQAMAAAAAAKEAEEEERRKRKEAEEQEEKRKEQDRERKEAERRDRERQEKEREEAEQRERQERKEEKRRQQREEAEKAQRRLAEAAEKDREREKELRDKHNNNANNKLDLGRLSPSKLALLSGLNGVSKREREREVKREPKEEPRSAEKEPREKENVGNGSARAGDDEPERKKKKPVRDEAGRPTSMIRPEKPSPDDVPPNKLSDHFQSLAKKKKRQADQEANDKLMRVLLYFDSTVHFILSARYFPNPEKNNQIVILRDTGEMLKLVTTQMCKNVAADQRPASHAKIIQIARSLSGRVQAVLAYQQYHLRQPNVQRWFHALQQFDSLVEVIPSPSSTKAANGAASPSSPASNNSNSRDGHANEKNQMVRMPRYAYEMQKKHMRSLNHLMFAHMFWDDEAVRIQRSQEVQSFFAHLDSLLPAPFSLDASLDRLCSYLLTGTGWLRFEYDAIKKAAKEAR